MEKPNKEQIEKAYGQWQARHYWTLDQEVEPFLQPLPQKGWLRRARHALMLSTIEVAARMDISPAAYSKLERNEASGKISINTLLKAAEALDCDLVYALRPKSQLPFSKVIWQKLLPDAAQHNWVKSRPAVFKIRALAGMATHFMGSPAYRRLHGWTQRSTLK